MSSASVRHPAPHRHKVHWLSHFAGLLGAPAAWVTQMMLSYSLASSACYPRRAPLHSPVWQWLNPALTGISVACLLAACLSTYIAWKSWECAKHEAEGTGKHTLDVGDGRTRFVSMIGMLANGIFLIAILFTGCAILVLSPQHPCI